MAYLVNFNTLRDKRGELTPIDGVLPFEIKRLYYIANITEGHDRGGHSHVITVEAIVCMAGSFTVYINNGREIQEYFLDTRSKCLIIEPYDWHKIHSFSPDALLMGISSTSYDHSDYIHEEPQLPQK